ncbi:MAG: hypothetical protein II707_00420 [Spirochaetales bacterium]|nr:hypothetical protein [Spirochaetales bacterium]
MAETSANHSKTIGAVVEDIEQSISQMQSDLIESVNSFGQLGANITDMEKHLDEIKLGMDEQSIGAKEILEVMNVLKSCANDVTDTASAMKKDCSAVTNMISELNTQADDVLKHTTGSIDILGEVQQLAQDASTQADTNKALSDQITEMLADYNV